jgi:MFS family permease
MASHETSDSHQRHTVEDERFEHEITDPVQEPHKLSIRTWIAIAAMMYTYSVSLGSFLILSPIVSYINQDLGPSASYTWIFNAWTISAGTGLVVAGSFSDLIGRRWFVVGTGAIAVIAAIIAVTAQSIGQS